MSTSIPFLPGGSLEDTHPLARYLPQIPHGVASAWLSDRFPPGTWVLDPFGTLPRLAIEFASQGYRVLVTANNPIARFLFEMAASPPTESELRLALADIAASQKAGERLEPHIRALYHTECAQCGSVIEAEAFIWERDAASPSARLYHCPHCKDEGEHPATQADAARAAHFTAGGLHRARALERVAPLNDPDRTYAVEALNTYLPRAVYALFTLINKLDATPLSRRRPLVALLLAALDQANTLWPYPVTRSRPLQLSRSTRFLEKNVWLALEGAIQQWNPGTASKPIPLTYWPNHPPETGGICLFEGRLKDLADQTQRLGTPDFRFPVCAAALPRPNQAFWTLSALWAGWLWGHEATSTFKSVLRRRRYDWSWHTAALHAAFRPLLALLAPDAPFLGLIGEIKTGFLAAAILSGDLAGFELKGVAVREDVGQAQISWQKPSQTISLPTALIPLSESTLAPAHAYLLQRGEPSSYLLLYAATLTALSQAHQLIQDPQISPPDLFRQSEEALRLTFSYRGGFTRYAGSQRSLDVGQWWLQDEPQPASQGDQPPLPLADRVEMEVVRYLQSRAGCSMDDLDRAMCNAFPGLFTPDLELIQACLNSYGVQSPDLSGVWRLRPEDAPRQRRSDLETMRALLVQLGERLGYQAILPDGNAAADPHTRQPLIWRLPGSPEDIYFYVIASAVLGPIVFSRMLLPSIDQQDLPRPHYLIVLPGGRSGLVDFKIRCNARLKGAVESGWGFLKFRHLRWLAENEKLDRHNLFEQITLDPLANTDLQMQLL